MPGGAARQLAKIRTITLGLTDAPEPGELHAAAKHLGQIKTAFEQAGFEVQMLRLTLPVSDALVLKHPTGYFADLNSACEQSGIALLGFAVLSPARVRQAADLVCQFERLTACALVLDQQMLPATAAAIRQLSTSTAGGLGNFHFCAAFEMPPHAPFFPAAYGSGRRAFSVGLENARYFNEQLSQSDGQENRFKVFGEAATKLYGAIEEISLNAAVETGLEFAGIDTSVAPGIEPDGSVRTLLGRMGAEFGRPGATAVCERITRLLSQPAVKQVGFRGLMLPVLEDYGLAGLNRLRMNDLLLCSAVCGVGLDMLPLAGNVSESRLAAVLSDVAAMASRLKKPLMARLLLAPGKGPGDMTAFESPYICNAPVMEI